MKLVANIDPRTAVQLGIAESGPQIIDITAADLASWTEEERTALAGMLNTTPGDASGVFQRRYADAGAQAAMCLDSYYLANLSEPGVAGVIRYVRDSITARAARAVQGAANQVAAEAAKAEREAAQAARSLAKSEAFLADQEARLRGDGSYQSGYNPAPTAEVIAENKRRLAVDAELKRVAKEIAAAEQVEKEAAETAKEAAKSAYIDAFVAQHGDPSEVERHAVGMLCREAIIERIVDQAFAPTSDRALYDKITASECRGEYCDSDCGLQSRITVDPCCTAEQWTALQSFRAAYPAADVHLLKHEAWTDYEHGAVGVERYGIRVTLSVGPFTFHREYAVE